MNPIASALPPSATTSLPPPPAGVAAGPDSSGPAEDPLRAALRRCPAATYEAAQQFRATGDPTHLAAIVRGVITRYVERDLRAKLQRDDWQELRLVEDLAIDSLTLMEIVLLMEEVLRIAVTNEELQGLRTLGDVERFLTAKLAPG